MHLKQKPHLWPIYLTSKSLLSEKSANISKENKNKLLNTVYRQAIAKTETFEQLFLEPEWALSQQPMRPKATQ